VKARRLDVLPDNWAMKNGRLRTAMRKSRLSSVGMQADCSGLGAIDAELARPGL